MTLKDQIISKCHTIHLFDKGIWILEGKGEIDRAKRCQELMDKTISELGKLFLFADQETWNE